MVSEMKPETLVKSVDDLLAERQAVAEKERELVQSLNGALRKMGYEVVPVDGGIADRPRRGRPPGSRGRPRGQPPTAGRRRGRPPKVKVETLGVNSKESGVRSEGMAEQRVMSNEG